MNQAMREGVGGSDVANVVYSPVFLVGALRSGTTLLRLMLDAHPDICNFGEFEYAVKYAEEDRLPDLDGFLARLELDRVFRSDGFSIQDGLDTPGLVRSFLDQAACRAGKPIVGATVHSRFDLLKAIWPSARFIHLVRDPRDVARSCIGMGWAGNVWYGADFWLDAERRWDRVRPTLADSDFVEVAYEDLVSLPEQTLDALCAFLGVDYSPQMLSYSESTTYSSPDQSLAYQWRRKLGESAISLVESKCEPLMQDRGYAIHTNAQRPPRYRRLGLSVQNSIAKKIFRLRRYGWRLSLSDVVLRWLPRESRWRRDTVLQMQRIDEALLK